MAKALINAIKILLMTEEKVQNEQENQPEKNQNETASNTHAPENSGENTENLQHKVNELNDKYLRLYSEFENFRRRSAKEKLEIIGNANEKLLSDLLPILDDFDRAIESNKTVEDIQILKQGFELLHNKMFNILSSNGLKPMEAKGKEFDVDLHEAITKIPAPNKKEKGKVFDVVEKGYHLNNKVLRFAKVVVAE